MILRRGEAQSFAPPLFVCRPSSIPHALLGMNIRRGQALHATLEP